VVEAQKSNFLVWGEERNLYEIRRERDNESVNLFQTGYPSTPSLCGEGGSILSSADKPAWGAKRSIPRQGKETTWGISLGMTEKVEQVQRKG